MADNRHKYGFRFYASMSGSGRPPAIEGVVATAYAPTPGGTSTGMTIGDPVELLSDGTFALAEDTADVDRLFGVIAGFSRAKVDNGRARPAAYLPSGTTWTRDDIQSRVLVLPFGRDIWEIDVDDVVTATTEAAYRAFIGENAQMTYSPDTAAIPGPKANPVLDISTHGTGALHFRIFGISKTKENADFSGANVKLLVQLNQGSEPMFTATGL